MKTNYEVLLLTFIINIFMALSLNSFTSPTLYLPMMFLYFLSGLAAFIDKIEFYKSAGQKFEKRISYISFLICLLGACLYIAYSLGFIEINFQCDNGTYKVLMQGVPNSFFTFNSINITPIIFSFVFILPFAYLALCLVSYLREQGFTMKKVKDILLNHKKTSFLPLLLSVFMGVSGVIFCHVKYHLGNHQYGLPQYQKYFIALFILSFCFSYLLYFLCHKND